METVAVSKLKANLTNFLQQASEGKSIVITSRGHEIARLVPPQDPRQEARKRLVQLRETAVIDDVLSPLDEPWEASS